ncbi:MAG TPA: tyrosine-type recombinase/integrase, partial [Streptosporangiaceae bacterium]|nr:tyrosine-type recombinase/integrase [Streptosporangiaceae bacterium]
MTPDEARELAGSWEISMQAARMSPHTIRTYLAGLETYIRWCESSGLDVALKVRQVEQFTASLLGGGAEAATALSRQKGVRRFSAWLATEDRHADPLARMKPPKLDEKAPAYLTPQQSAALLATCEGPDFNDVRDAAIIELMRESMVRADELLSMRTDDVDIKGRKALVRRGKGGKARLVAFSAQTARRIDRYARARRRRPEAPSEWFWLPARRTGKDRL